MVEVVHNSEDVEEINESKEDGTIVPSAEEHVFYRFQLDHLFPF